MSAEPLDLRSAIGGTAVRASPWRLSDRFDPEALPLADRHYNRQKRGARQFTRPARQLVLLTADRGALWVSIWPKWAQHAWSGAWECQIFRRERGERASDLIRLAVAPTVDHFGPPPALGMVTFVDPAKVSSVNPGYCFKRAGFVRVGLTLERKRVVLQLLPDAMPESLPVPRRQLAFALEGQQ